MVRAAEVVGEGNSVVVGGVGWSVVVVVVVCVGGCGWVWGGEGTARSGCVLGLVNEGGRVGTPGR